MKKDENKQQIEIVKDFDKTFYCNLKGINEYISLKQLKEEIKEKYNILINLNEFEKTKVGRKIYYIKAV